MKTILFLLALCLSLGGCSAQTNEKVIGVDKNGVYEVTVDAATLKVIFGNSIAEKELANHLVTYQIKKDVVENTTQTYYYLLASNTDGSIKIATDLDLGTDGTFTAKMSLQLDNAFGSTCTCSGSCTKGCDPKHWRDKEGDINWRCSACTQKNKTCNKSVTDN